MIRNWKMVFVLQFVDEAVLLASLEHFSSLMIILSVLVLVSSLKINLEKLLV